MTDSQEDKLVRLVTSSGQIELVTWQNALREAGVRFRTHRENRLCSMFPGKLGEIWIRESDLDRAKVILKRYLPRGQSAELYFGW